MIFWKLMLWVYMYMYTPNYYIQWNLYIVDTSGNHLTAEASLMHQG